MHQWTGFTRTAMAIAVAVMAAAPSWAQNTTASVAGRVTGADGQPVAGATVTLVHVESGSTNNATTSVDGRYNARGLRTGGPYTLTISKGGLTERRDGVFLSLAETLDLDATLGQPAQTVVVTGRGVSNKFNSSNMGAGTTIGSRELAGLASVQRNLQDYARTDPRLAQTDKERGEISAAGQNTRYNSITIDGVTTSDTFGLEANNLPTAKQPISIDAIQSVQINVSNYDVTQKGYTGANINAVTKSGTNEFHGSVYYVWRDESLAGKRYNRTTESYFEPAPFEQTTRGFTLGGPIVKDKLFFFGSYEEYKGPPATGLPGFGPLGSGLTNVGISQSSIDEALRISRDVWGIEPGTQALPGALDLTVKDTLFKLDWNISDAHRASVRYAKTEQSEPFIVGFSATGLSASSHWYNQDKEIESLVGQWFADWTDTFSTEIKISRRDYTSVPTPFIGGALPQIGLRFSGLLPAGTPAAVNANNRFFNIGTERSRHLNVLETKTEDLYAGATWNLGAHELKFGVDYADNEVYNAFLQDVNGQYTFGCEPGTYSFGTFANCDAMTPAQRERATLENYARGLPSAYQVQGPRAGRVLADGIGIWSIANTGLFLQDTWKLNQAVNLTFGLRVDQQKVPTKPARNEAAAAAPIAGSVSSAGVVTRASGGFGYDNTETLDGNTLAQPRLGFNWNLGTPERRMQLRGGVGLFQGASANVWLSNPYSNTGVAVSTLSCASFTACSTADNGGQVRFSPNPANQPVLRGTAPAANVDFISPDLEQPSVWKANLAFETELPPLPAVGRLVAGVEWLHTETQTGVFYEHLNLGATTRLGSDGRNLYYRAEGYNGACWNTNGTPITNGTCATPAGQTRTRALSNPNFSNVLLAKETGRGRGDAVTFSIGQPSTVGLSWNLAYTRTSANEVNPLTSSTSGSNWSNRNIFNPNEEAVQNSNYLIKDRFSATALWSRAFIPDYRTTVGVFYEGRRGKPYSWTYLNDLNGDGIAGNDLMYVPTAPGSGEVAFRGGAAEEQRFFDIVSSNPMLASARGGLVGRNNTFAPWVNNFDVRVSQELPGFTKAHKASVALDILNFGNLLSKKWGRIDEIAFPSNRSFVNYNGIDAQGRYIYSLGTLEDLRTVQDKGESQWAMQLTLRYEF